VSCKPPESLDSVSYQDAAGTTLEGRSEGEEPSDPLETLSKINNIKTIK